MILIGRTPDIPVKLRIGSDSLRVFPDFFRSVRICTFDEAGRVGFTPDSDPKPDRRLRYEIRFMSVGSEPILWPIPIRPNAITGRLFLFWLEIFCFYRFEFTISTISTSGAFARQICSRSRHSIASRGFSTTRRFLRPRYLFYSRSYGSSSQSISSNSVEAYDLSLLRACEQVRRLFCKGSPRHCLQRCEQLTLFSSCAAFSRRLGRYESWFWKWTGMSSFENTFNQKSRAHVLHHLWRSRCLSSWERLWWTFEGFRLVKSICFALIREFSFLVKMNLGFLSLIWYCEMLNELQKNMQSQYFWYE